MFCQLFVNNNEYMQYVWYYTIEIYFFRLVYIFPIWFFNLIFILFWGNKHQIKLVVEVEYIYCLSYEHKWQYRSTFSKSNVIFRVFQQTVGVSP